MPIPLSPFTILIAFLGPNDPTCNPLVEDFSEIGPLIQTIRLTKPAHLVLLITPDAIERQEKLFHALKKESPLLSINPIYLSETFSDYDATYQCLSEALAPWVKESSKVAFLPNCPSAVWQTAALVLFANLFPNSCWLNLRENKYDSHTLPSIESLRKVSSSSNSFSLAAPKAPFLNDAAEALGLIGEHPLFQEALETAAAIAAHSTPVLICGATGTGKDVFARFIHTLSNRRNDAFIAINCAALPETLAESILFGHVKGAFTGASSNQIGKFSQAHNGTLFLDEIGELPLKIQAKLLRVIEDGMVDPIGSSKPEKVNMRLIAATNRNLKEEIKKGNFREDLYYRLRIGEFTLPSLKERRSDIVKIALFLLKRINRSLKDPRCLSKAALEALELHDWPGNVRDLQNVLERAAILSKNTTLGPKDLRLTHPADNGLVEEDNLPALYPGFSIESYLSNLREKIIHKALEKAAGRQTKAAELLGISPQAINRFVRERVVLKNSQAPAYPQERN